ncbi:hypothetical protein [Massilia sp. TS11]|uniref:hypothetical protein n=1 Tax=Massilia sp. TS11 TaxID=2908003 RepID=UPI001EDA1244|nr:hypothetical protein [Massilia sp. TS11]MCG2582928.1 hypothetical protein [Massilia sp. TS11]
MQRLAVLILPLALSACHLMAPTAPAPAPVQAKPVQLDSDGQPRVSIDGVDIERLPFQPGVSSVTVEKMGKAAGCTGGVGAGLVTPAGPVEVYRMRCDNGKTFMARCELRQCTAMP